LWAGRLGEILAALAESEEFNEEAETARADVASVRQKTFRGR
jgi:hypothetical protein